MVPLQRPVGCSAQESEVRSGPKEMSSFFVEACMEHHGFAVLLKVTSITLTRSCKDAVPQESSVG